MSIMGTTMTTGIYMITMTMGIRTTTMIMGTPMRHILMQIIRWGRRA